MLNMLRTLLNIRLLLGALAVALLCLLIWLAGPLVAIGDARPLRCASVRAGAILLLLLLWVLLRSLPLYRHLRLQKRLRQQLGEAEPSAGAPDNVQALTDGFKRAIALLRYHRYCGGGIRWLLSCLPGRDYLYQTPWYLVLGADGCGKQQALRNAGLDLYQPPRSDAGQPESGRAGGGHCEWYLTPHGVLISPASGYLAEGNLLWQKLLDHLARYRHRLPINGVVLAISAQDFLQDSPDEQYQQAMLLRKRLLEQRRRFGTDVPIYVMVTKTDRLAGFSAYFSRFDGPELEQAWGMAFAWQANRPDDGSFEHAFADQYDRLQQRLERALADTLVAETDARLRARSFVFPQAFAALRPSLVRYLSIVFAPSRYDRRLSLRGLYFTSANQKAARPRDVPSDCRDNLFDYSYTPDHPGEGGAVPVPQSYFLHSLFTRVIFAEGHLAASGSRRITRRRVLMAAGYCMLLLSLVAAGGVCLASYNNNQAYLEQVDQRTRGLEQESAALSRQPTPGLQQLLPFFDRLERVARSEAFDLERPPLDYRLGLYQGARLKGSVEVVYQHTLKRLLLPLVSIQLTATLRQADFSDTAFIYESLKAYQMLYDANHYDGDFLLAWSSMTLEDLPGAKGLNEEERRRLCHHLSRLLKGSALRSPLPKDNLLVAEAQAAIRAVPLAQRVYRRVQVSAACEEALRAVTLADLAGERAGRELVRKSGASAGDAVSGLFTPRGYWHGVHPRIETALASLLREDRWIVNLETPEDRRTLADRVRYLYLNDYILQWDAFLEDIALATPLSLHQRTDSLRILSGPRSPLRNLAVGLVPILSLMPPEQSGGQPKISQRIEAGTQRMLGELLGEVRDATLPPPPEHMVSHHYRDLLDAAGRQSEGAQTIPFDAILAQLDGLYHCLASQPADDEALSCDRGELPDRLRADAKRLPTPLRQLVLSAADGAGQDSRRRTWQRLRRLFDMRIGGLCRYAIDGRYPLTPGARLDISPDDLARLFAPGRGLTDKFFQQYLVDRVETGETEWRFAAGANAVDDADLLRLPPFFQQARRISDALFQRGGEQPSFSFTLRPVSMDNRILTLTLDFDGQVLYYSHGPSFSWHLTWPGKSASGRARLTAQLADGTSRSLEERGAWALHRLLDAAISKQAVDDGSTRRLIFSLDGHQITLDVTPDSLHDPFLLPAMECLIPRDRLSPPRDGGRPATPLIPYGPAPLESL